MKIVGVLPVVAGVVLLAGGVLIGIPFSGVYLVGFVGTSGREAGGELAVMLLFTLTAGATAFVLIKAGRTLLR